MFARPGKCLKAKPGSGIAASGARERMTPGKMDKVTASDPTVFSFFNEIGAIDQLATNLMERYLPSGLTLPQYSVLNHFVRLEGMHTPLGLARAFQVTKGAMTNTLKKLERHGFISVKSDPGDGRRKQVRITDAGHEAWRISAARLRPVEAMISGRFPDSDIEKLLPMLRDMRQFLDENRNLPDHANDQP